MPGQLFHHLDGSQSHYIPIEEDAKPIHITSPKSPTVKIIKKLLLSTFVTFSLFLPQSLNDPITFYYAGFVENSSQFAAIGFTIALSTLFVTRFTSSCILSMQFLIKQAIKQQQYYRITSHYQKTTILLIMSVSLATAIVLIIATLLPLFRFTPDFTEGVQIFSLLMIPYSFSNLLLNLMKGLYSSYESTGALICTAWFRLIINIALNSIFRKAIGSGLLSVGISRSLSELITAVTLYAYTKKMNKFVQALSYPWVTRTLKDYRSFFRFLVLKALPIYIERTPLDLLTVVIAFLYQMELIAAQACLSAYAVFILALPLSICLSTSKHLKMAIEEGSEWKAKTYTIAGCTMCFVVCAVLSGINFLLADPIPRAFGYDSLFQITMSRFIGMYIIVLWGEMALSFLSIVFRNFLDKSYTLKALVTCVWVVGFGLSVGLTFFTQLDVYGIWVGRMSGLLLVNIVMAQRLGRLDWWQQVRKTYFWFERNQFNEVLVDL